jgi:hypothetical protein
VNRTDRVQQLPPRSYGKPEASTAVNRLLMMGIGIPETCRAIYKRQTINLQLIAASGWLVNSFECVVNYLIFRRDLGFKEPEVLISLSNLFVRDPRLASDSSFISRIY